MKKSHLIMSCFLISIAAFCCCTSKSIDCKEIEDLINSEVAEAYGKLAVADISKIEIINERKVICIYDILIWDIKIDNWRIIIQNKSAEFIREKDAWKNAENTKSTDINQEDPG